MKDHLDLNLKKSIEIFLPQQELIIEYYGLLGNKEYEDETL